VESIFLLIVFFILLLGVIAFLVYKAYQIGHEAGLHIGYGKAVQDFLTQQTQAMEQQQFLEQQQLALAEKEAKMEASAIGFKTNQEDGDASD